MQAFLAWMGFTVGAGAAPLSIGLEGSELITDTSRSAKAPLGMK